MDSTMGTIQISSEPANKNLRTMLSKFKRHWSILKDMYIVKNRHDIESRERGIRIREKLSLLYAVIMWNAFGFAFYTMVKNRMPTDSAEKRTAFLNLTGAPGKLHVYQIEGFQLKNEFDVEKEEETKDMEEELE